MERVQKEYKTTIDKTYTVPFCEYLVPSSRTNQDQAVFSAPSKELLDQNLNEVSKINDFQKIPEMCESNTYEEYLGKLEEWKEEVKKVQSEVVLPMPMSYNIPKYVLPDIISAEKWSDSIVRRRLIRNYNAEKSNLGSENFIELDKLLQSSKEYKSDDTFSVKGLNDQDVLIGSHCYDKPAWCSRLVIKRPEPKLFRSFEKYEAAMMKWSEKISSMDFLPPSSKQIGDIMQIKSDNKVSSAGPPPPQVPTKVKKSYSTLPIDEDKMKPKLLDLFKEYKLNLTNPDDSQFKVKKIRSYKPPHCKLSASKIIKSLIAFGAPIQLKLDDLTSAFIFEKSCLDSGYLAKREFVARSSIYDISKDLDEIIKILLENPIKFLLTDFSIYEFNKLLLTKIPGEEITIGKKLSELISLESIIKLSSFAASNRSYMKFSVLAIYLLPLKSIQDQLVQLDLSQLERYVELISTTATNTFPSFNIFDEEIKAAINHDPQKEKLIERLVMEISQANLIHSLSSIAFLGNNYFFNCFNFLRDLIFSSYQMVVEEIKIDSVFQEILKGLLCTNKLVNMFYFKLIRVVIQIDYSRCIRVLSGYDLLTFFQKGIESNIQHIRKNTKSLFQLMLHSEASIAFQLQITQSSPSFVYNLITSSPEDFLYFLLSIFSSFKNVESKIDYVPFQFAQFKGYIDLLSSDLNNKRNSKFLRILLHLCITGEATFSFKQNEFKSLINSFAHNFTSSLDTSNRNNFGCFITLLKIKYLDPSYVQDENIWNYTLQEMCSKKDIGDYRYLLWKAFRNAVLNQKQFVEFLVENQNLSKLLSDNFSSLDITVISCMVRILTEFAQALNRNEDIANLKVLFNFLSQPTVYIASKILSTYKQSQEPTMRKLHSILALFITLLIKAPAGSTLNQFMNAQPIISNLGEVFSEIAKINGFTLQINSNTTQQ